MIYFLDLDDTLLDFKRAEEENFRLTLASFGIPDGGLYARFHQINDGLWKLLERGGIARETLKVERFRLLFEERGICADAGAVARTYFENFAGICFPFDGAADFLKELAGRGSVYIATNGSACIQTRHMRDAGFLPYITAAFISETMGADKPSEQYCDGVRAKIPAFDPRRSVFMGDSLTSDMVCAERLGVPFVLFAPAGAPEGYRGRLARTFREALSVFDRI